jgi:hypothetical protein
MLMVMVADAANRIRLEFSEQEAAWARQLLLDTLLKTRFAPFSPSRFALRLSIGAGVQLSVHSI